MGRRGAEYQEPERGWEKKAWNQGHTQNTQKITKAGAEFACSVVRHGGELHLFEHRIGAGGDKKGDQEERDRLRPDTGVRTETIPGLGQSTDRT